MDFAGGACAEEPACQYRRHKRCGLIPGLGRSPGGGHDSLFQCSCLGNPKDRGAWRAAVHGVTKSRTRLKHLSMRVRTHTHAHMHSATYVFCCSDGSSLDRWGLLHLAPVSTWILLFLLLPPASCPLLFLCRRLTPPSCFWAPGGVPDSVCFLP